MTEALNTLREAFNNKNLSLYLGAGVSIDNNLPSWEKLMLAMYYSKISEEKLEGWRPYSNYLYAISEWHLLNSTEPPEIIARKLRKYYSDNKEEDEFYNNMYRTLYGSLLDNNGEPFSEITKDFIRTNNPTLNSIAELCEGNGVCSVITYNYDNLLEIALDNFPYHSIFKPEQKKSGQLPIYHVHGYVPIKLDGSEEGSKGIDLVFSENQYHQIAGNPYYWSNLVQLQSMSNSVCLLVGLSLTDRSMRRLLDAVTSSHLNNTNFVFLKQPDTYPPDDDILDEINDNAIKYFNRFNKSGIKGSQNIDSSVFFRKPGVKSSGTGIKSLRSGKKGPRYRVEIAGIIEEIKRLDQEQQEYVLKELGLTPLWFKDFSDIPSIISSILSR